MVSAFLSSSEAMLEAEEDSPSELGEEDSLPEPDEEFRLLPLDAEEAEDIPLSHPTKVVRNKDIPKMLAHAKMDFFFISHFPSYITLLL